jgi:hypothetical protein
MGSTYQEEISFLVSSNPSLGASNVSPDGSQFSVVLDQGGLFIPSEALAVRVSVPSAEIWWTVFNISAKIGNNKFYVFGDNDAGGTQLFTLTLADGLYDLSNLNATILSELESEGARTISTGTTPLPLLNLQANTATQRVIVRLNYGNVRVEWLPDSPFTICGFDVNTTTEVPPGSAAPINIPGDTEAKFNTISSFLLHSSIVQQGLRLNSTFNQTIASVQIDVAPGSQINYQPFSPAEVFDASLSGGRINLMTFWLTDQNNNPVDTAGEYFALRLSIKFSLPTPTSAAVRNSILS